MDSGFMSSLRLSRLFITSLFGINNKFRELACGLCNQLRKYIQIPNIFTKIQDSGLNRVRTPINVNCNLISHRTRKNPENFFNRCKRALYEVVQLKSGFMFLW